MFEQGDVSTGIQIANTLIVPALVQLTEENYLEREMVLEKVREEWCQCLNRPDLDECMCACDSVCVVSEGGVVSVSQQT